MADFLKLVREYFSNKKEIVELNDQIILGEFSWNKNAKTNILIWGSGKNGTPKAYHTLADIVFFLKKIELFHPDYVRDATEAKMQVVRRPMRKELHAYFKGNINQCSFIDTTGPREKPTQVLQNNGQRSSTNQKEKSNYNRSESHRHDVITITDERSPSPSNSSRMTDQVTPKSAQSNSGSLQPLPTSNQPSMVLQRQPSRENPNSGLNRQQHNSGLQQPPPSKEQTDTERIQLSPISDQSSYDEFIIESPPSKRTKSRKTASLRNKYKTLDTPGQDNEYEIFGRHVACELHKMSERQAIIAQEQIQAVISRCRLDNLNM